MPDTVVDTPVVDNDDLDAFSKEFFNHKVEDTPVEVAEEVQDTDETPVEETVDDDTVATEQEDEDTEASESEDESEDEEDEKPHRNRKTAKERIRELNTRAHEAERREAETLHRLRDLEEKLAPREEPKEVKAPTTGAPDPDALKADGEPVYPLGEYDPKFVVDLAKFAVAEDLKAAREADAAERTKAQEQTKRTELQNDWLSRLDVVEEEIPDIKEKIVDLAEHFEGLDENYGNYLVQVIQTLENGPYVLNYLSENPEEAQKLVSSGATSATIALGRLDTKLSKPVVEEKVAKVTKAPTPPAQIPRGTGSKFAAAADTDDLDAFSKVFFKK